MRPLSVVFGLPATLLLFLDPSSSAAETCRSNETLATSWPQDAIYRRRNIDALKRHRQASPNAVGVKKMTSDEGAKFFPEYWQFEDLRSEADALGAKRGGHDKLFEASTEPNIDGDGASLRNLSMSIAYHAPYALHQQSPNPLSRDIFDNPWGRSDRRNIGQALERRGYQCPTGTESCSDIGYPNSCCASGEVCFTVADTGLGPVGCCPSGEECSGATSCGSNTACSDTEGGGCCLPGYSCEGVGCVIEPSAVTTVITTIIVTVAGSSTTQVLTSTSILTPAESSTSTTTTSSSSVGTGLQTTLACSPSYQACPVSLGGGCCPSSRLCGATDCPTSPGATSSSSSTSTTTSNSDASAPIRPTSISTTSSPSSSTATDSICPTGFYACSAYYEGGCCRTGRDCDTTSCPAQSSSTLVSSGQTIVIPVTASATTTASSTCASGWFSCAATLGGDCCPSGFVCGSGTLCTTTGAGVTAVQSKADAISAGTRSVGEGMEGWGMWLVFYAGFTLARGW